MADFKLDRIKFRWKGNWIASAEYRKDDIVYYNGKSYVCMEGHTSETDFYDDRDVANPITLDVTVSTDTLSNASHGVFYINGEESPALKFRKGNTYVIDQTDLSNKEFNSQTHPFMFSTTPDGILAGGALYEDGVTYFLDEVAVSREDYIANFFAASVRTITFIVPETAPDKIYYFSAINLGMGNEARMRYSSYWELMLDGQPWQGDWEGGRYYSEGDIVKYYGYLYQCVNAHTSTVVISLGLTGQISNWRIYATSYNWLSNWTRSTYYRLGDVVRYGGNVYICNTKHLSAGTFSDGLELDILKWTTVTRNDNWTADWEISTRYKKDDIVKYGGVVYRCDGAHTSADNTDDGLEDAIDHWVVVSSGIEYKGNWQSAFRYKLNDVVKSGGALWKSIIGHISTDSLRVDEAQWEIYVPGVEFEEVWDSLVEYNKGDIVLYGGYSYLALTNNTNSIPSVSGILQDTGDWELLTTGYRFRQEWETSVAYFTGDVVTDHGYLYINISDATGVQPDSNPLKWQILNTGNKWYAEWDENFVTYKLGDIVTYAGTAYTCIQRHISTTGSLRPDTDVAGAGNYWTVLIQGSPSNVLIAQGDIKTYTTESTRLPIGDSGKAMKVDPLGLSAWLGFDQVPKVYYVSVYGQDIEGAGLQLAAPFRTVKYACEYILEDEENRAPATIFIKTGIYEEQLPISIPANVALVGDELRSTTIIPAAGYETSNMFYVRNGSGIRNMTLQGLSGVLGPQNEYLTSRPTAGAFVSLDPGTGTADTSVWISTRSPYVQNVTTFGTGCIGMKIDGALHAGGNRSIVANDFTQVLSDGIGYWASNSGRSELVSVFTYFCHVGYLADNGGILRATNGNNSYGDWGSVAEGYDVSETPITGLINNRSLEAQYSSAITYGTTEQKILAISYKNAGQEYSTASVQFGGSGNSARGRFNEFRNNAVYEIRVVDNGDSSIPGGLNYTRIVNNAQTGTSGTITLAAADIADSDDYLGHRIVVISGKGVGQYGTITGFDPLTKIAQISREGDLSNGWDHFQPGWPIEATLDETSRYSIEPNVYIEEPAFDAAAITAPSNELWSDIIFANNKYVAISSNPSGDTVSTTSSDGETWSSINTIGSNLQTAGIVHNGTRYIVNVRDISGGGSGVAYYSTTGESWTSAALPLTASWESIASNREGTSVIVAVDGTTTYSGSGTSWSLGNTIQGGMVDSEWKHVAHLPTKFWVNPAALITSHAAWVAGTTSEDLYDFWDETLESGYKRGDFDISGVKDSTDTTILENYYTDTPGNTGPQNTLIRTTEAILIQRKLLNFSLYPDSYFSTDGIFIAFDSVNGFMSWSVDGNIWKTYQSTVENISNVGIFPEYTYLDSVFGNNRLIVLVSDGISSRTLVTFNGIEWQDTEQPYDFTSVSYGSGMFIATTSSSSNVVGKSKGGVHWRTFDDDSTTFTTTSSGNWVASAHKEGKWVLINQSSATWNTIETGTRTIARAIVENSKVTRLEIFDPGSNYVSAPAVTLVDNFSTIPAALTVRTGNGVLAQPEMVSRGNGYVSATATITGDGFADIYQTGGTLILSTVSRIPRPGDNLNINGINDVQYSISRVNSESGSGPYEIEVEITPYLGVAESPEHNTGVTLRQKFSQIRLTGHDFLDIGTGSTAETRYPELYIFGQDPENPRRPENETNAEGGGRVFYTSTDQDGNFRVGELFQVEQNSGIVSINAAQFNLSGLTELSLGGVQVGGSAVVIREFSKEKTFVANSNNIVPTQAAILSYIESRISGGGSAAFTNTLIAGQVRITNNQIDTTSGYQINIPVKANLTKGHSGHFLASQYFAAGGVIGSFSEN